MILYSRLDDRKTYAEFWGASTKHPDSVSCLQNDVERGKFSPCGFLDSGLDNLFTIADILQWLMYVASTKTWIFHAIELIEEVQEIYADLKATKTPLYE